MINWQFRGATLPRPNPRLRERGWGNAGDFCSKGHRAIQLWRVLPQFLQRLAAKILKEHHQRSLIGLLAIDLNYPFHIQRASNFVFLLVARQL